MDSIGSELTRRVAGLAQRLASGEDGQAADAAAAIGNIALMRTAGVKAVVDAGAMPPLVALLASDKDRVVASATKAIWRMAYCSAAGVKAVVDAGAMPPLVALLASDKDQVVASAAHAISKVIHRNAAGVKAVVDAGAMPPLVALLASDKDRVVVSAAEIINNLASLDECKLTIAASGAVASMSVHVESSVSWAHLIGSVHVSIEVTEALRSLASGSMPVKRALIETGVLDPLAAALHRATSHDIMARVCSVLQSLVCCELVSHATCKENLVPGLVHALGLPCPDLRGQALHVLHAISKVSCGACRMLVEAECVPALRHPMQLEGAQLQHRMSAMRVLLMLMRRTDAAAAALADCKELLDHVIAAAGGAWEDSAARELGCLCSAQCLQGAEQCKLAVSRAGGLKPIADLLKESESAGHSACELRWALEDTAGASKELREAVKAAGFEG